MDDEQQTPMADKVIDFGDQPTPRAHSENGSTSQRDDLWDVLKRLYTQNQIWNRSGPDPIYHFSRHINNSDLPC